MTWRKLSIGPLSVWKMEKKDWSFYYRMRCLLLKSIKYACFFPPLLFHFFTWKNSFFSQVRPSQSAYWFVPVSCFIFFLLCALTSRAIEKKSNSTISKQIFASDSSPLFFSKLQWSVSDTSWKTNITIGKISSVYHNDHQRWRQNSWREDCWL